MITITDTITITIITIAIVTISPGWNLHTYIRNGWEASSRVRCKIQVGDLFSTRFNCLPFLQNLRLQLSTPRPWGIVRSRRSGRAKIRFRLWYRPPSWFQPPPTRLLVPGPCNSAILWIEHPGAYLGTYSQVRMEVSCLLRVYLRACSGVCLRASWELSWEHTVEQARSAPSSAIVRVLESMPESMLQSFLRAYVGAYR